MLCGTKNIIRGNFISNLEKTIELKILNHHRSETVFANIIPAVERRGEERRVVVGELYCINTTHRAASHVTTQKGLALSSALRDAGGGASWCRNIRRNYYGDGELNTFLAFLYDSQSNRTGVGNGIVLDEGKNILQLSYII